MRYHMHRQAWSAITPEGASPGAPDLQPYQLLHKQYGKIGGARQLYFLDAVVQNAMEGHADMHVSLVDGKPTCMKCNSDIGSQSAWEHFVVGR